MQNSKGQHKLILSADIHGIVLRIDLKCLSYRAVDDAGVERIHDQLREDPCEYDYQTDSHKST